MSDDVKNTGYDDSFWADVDALRAMLEEEEANEPAPAASPKGLPRTGSAEPAEKQLNLNFQSQNARSAEFEEYDFSRGSQPIPTEKSSHKQKKSRGHSHRRSSRGLIITLYVIIVLELTALCGVAASWYLWIQ